MTEEYEEVLADYEFNTEPITTDIDLYDGTYDLTNIVEIPQCCYLVNQELTEYHMWLTNKHIHHTKVKDEHPDAMTAYLGTVKELEAVNREMSRRNLK